jgi:membrane-associated phospholipid phosphatase
MSQRLVQAPLQRPLAPSTPPRWEALTRAMAAGGSLLVVSALAYDIISGVWIGRAGLHLVLALLAVAVTIPVARRVPQLHLAVLYVFGLFVYTVLRSFADRTSIPVRSGYVIAIDRLLFFGVEPTRWLQERFFDPTRIHPLDWLTVHVHWSYFALPHLTAVAVFLWRRELFARYVALVLGTFYAGLVIYFLVPTMPPWLAADAGILPGVWRVMDFVGGQVDRDTYQRLYDALGVPNPVAAMPSLHMAVTTALFLFGRGLNRWLGRALAVYVLLMGFSLVYMGEHYVTDVLVGAFMACCVYKAVVRLVPLRLQPQRARRSPR